MTDNSEQTEIESPKGINSPSSFDAPKKSKRTASEREINLPREKYHEIWLSVSEASVVGGVQPKTVRRAIQSSAVKYKIVKDRYSIQFTSLITYLHSNKKLRNKLYEHGIGQYIVKWQ